MLALLHSRVSCSPLPHARPHLYNLSLRTSNGLRGTNGPARSGIRPWILVGLDKGKGYCDLEPLDCDRDIYYKTLEIPRASLRNVWKAASQKICCPVRVLTLCGAASPYQIPMGPSVAARPLDRTRVMRIVQIGEIKKNPSQQMEDLLHGRRRSY